MWTPSTSLPPDNVTLGSTGHVAHHDLLHDALVEVRAHIPSTASEVGAVNAAGAVTAVGGKLWFGTAAQYTALATKDATTLYVVT